MRISRAGARPRRPRWNPDIPAGRSPVCDGACIERVFVIGCTTSVELHGCGSRRTECHTPVVRSLRSPATVVQAPFPETPVRRRRRSHDPPEGGTQKESARMDRDKSLDMALGQIEKQFGKGAIMRLGERGNVGVEAIPTGALALDLALGIGGLPRGRIVEIFGPESSGKSTLAMHVVAEAQRNGGTCAYIDAEHAMDPVYASRHRRERRRPADLPAGHGGAGARDRRHADPLGRARRARDRLGGRARAPRRDRGRDGRHATSVCRPG